MLYSEEPSLSPSGQGAQGSDVQVKGRRFFSSPNGQVAAEGALIL